MHQAQPGRSRERWDTVARQICPDAQAYLAPAETTGGYHGCMDGHMDRETKAAPEHITPTEMAKALGVGVKAVYTHVLTPQSGLLYHQVGHRKVVGRAAFFAWLNGQGPKQ